MAWLKENTGGRRYRTYPPHEWRDAVDFLRLSDNTTSPANVAFSDMKDCKFDRPLSFCNKVLTVPMAGPINESRPDVPMAGPSNESRPGPNVTMAGPSNEGRPGPNVAMAGPINESRPDVPMA